MKNKAKERTETKRVSTKKVKQPFPPKFDASDVKITGFTVEIHDYAPRYTESEYE